MGVVVDEQIKSLILLLFEYDDIQDYRKYYSAEYMPSVKVIYLSDPYITISCSDELFEKIEQNAQIFYMFGFKADSGRYRFTFTSSIIDGKFDTFYVWR